jgi:hypothetical protein
VRHLEPVRELGGQAGHHVVRADGAAKLSIVVADLTQPCSRCCIVAPTGPHDGYTVHAGVVLGANDRAGIGRLAQYVLRPAL